MRKWIAGLIICLVLVSAVASALRAGGPTGPEAGEFCAPFAKAKELAQQSEPAGACSEWQREADGTTFTVIYCIDNSIALVAEAGDDMKAVGYAPMGDQYLVIEDGFVKPVPKEIAVEIAFQFFRQLVSKGLI